MEKVNVQVAAKMFKIQVKQQTLASFQSRPGFEEEDDEVKEALGAGNCRQEGGVAGPGPCTKVIGGPNDDNNDGGKDKTSLADIDPSHVNPPDLDIMEKLPGELMKL